MNGLLGTTIYTIEFHDKLTAERAYFELSDLYYFDDKINTIYYGHHIDILNQDLLDEIQYCLDASNIDNYTILLNKTIGI